MITKDRRVIVDEARNNNVDGKIRWKQVTKLVLCAYLKMLWKKVAPLKKRRAVSRVSSFLFKAWTVWRNFKYLNLFIRAPREWSCVVIFLIKFITELPKTRVYIQYIQFRTLWIFIFFHAKLKNFAIFLKSCKSAWEWWGLKGERW